MGPNPELTYEYSKVINNHTDCDNKRIFFPIVGVFLKPIVTTPDSDEIQKATNGFQNP